MSTLWGGDSGMDREVAEYTAADDREWDARLLRWDLLGSIAHAGGLRTAGVLKAAEHARIVRTLRAGLASARAGKLRVTARDEDVHTTVERLLVTRLGATGEKINTGRSRNDQVLLDLRLYTKDALLDVAAAALDAGEALRRFGSRHARVVFPGYTHQRRAMPSTFGVWAAGFAEGLIDDAAAIMASLERLDRSPLGSAAGFGVPLRLPRAAVARALGFAGVQRGVTAVSASRGKLEVVALAALWSLGSTLGKLSWDAILFTSEEFGFLTLPARFATGSSIMPHKRNPDVFELTRAREGVLAGCLSQAIAIAGKLPSGYHRDLQLLKAPLMTATDTSLAMARIVAHVVPSLEVDKTRCAAALDDGVFATDAVYEKVRAGVPFRSAYREVAAAVKRGDAMPRPAAAALLASRREPGGAGDPALAAIGREIRAARRNIAARRRGFDRALARLSGGPVA